MEKMSFLATQNAYQNIEVTFCTELPESIYLVKLYHAEGIELFFDAALSWTSADIDEAENLLQANLIYA